MVLVVSAADGDEEHRSGRRGVRELQLPPPTPRQKGGATAPPDRWSDGPGTAARAVPAGAVWVWGYKKPPRPATRWLPHQTQWPPPPSTYRRTRGKRWSGGRSWTPPERGTDCRERFALEHLPWIWFKTPDKPLFSIRYFESFLAGAAAISVAKLCCPHQVGVEVTYRRDRPRIRLM